MKPTCVRINVEPRRHSISVHDAIFDLSIDPHVGIVGLYSQHKRPRWLVLQDGCVQAVVLTLKATGSTVRELNVYFIYLKVNFTHLLEHRLIVVDVIDSHDDLRRAAEWVRPP